MYFEEFVLKLIN